MKTRQYNNGDTCTISANPGSHYTFDGWYENNTLVSSNNPYSFTVNSDKTLEGKFTAKSYTITTATSPVSGGSISGGGTYDYGDTCTLTATENAGFTFATWVDENNNFLSNSNPYTFTVSGDLTAKALFSTNYNTYTITVISNHGTVSGAGTYALNDTCTLTATPSPGYTFDHWEMNGVEISDDNPYSFTVNGDKTITAVYEVIPAALRITTSGSTSVILTNSSNQTYTWNLSAGRNYYTGTEPGFALNEITNLRKGGGDTSHDYYLLSIDASELTSWTTVENSAFRFLSNLNSIILPDYITSIGNLAFYSCMNLSSMTLPNSLTTIVNGAFDSCTSLTSINIPANVSSILGNTFGNCNNLTTITVDSNNQYYNDGNGSNCIIETATNKLIVGCNYTTIPNTVEIIGDGAFDKCTFTSITLPNTITSIEATAFYGCTGLTSITLPNSLTSIGDLAFASCSGLTSITLPNTITDIGNQAFNGCSGLTSITIPRNVSSIGWGIVGNCESLTSLTVDSNNAYYNDGNGSNCIIETATNILTSGCNYTTIPNTVVEIGFRAFASCQGLTSITLPNTITSIGTDAFYNCHGLTSITLSASLTTIGSGAFDNCDSLTSITLPNTITDIGSWAFEDCTSLTSITCLATIPPTLGNYNVFTNTNNCPIYVPAASLSAYQTEWSDYASRIYANPNS